MINPVELPQQQTNAKSSLILLILLLVAVFTLSLSAIFIRLSEQYIGPNAIVFNRYWISTVLFGLWEGIRVFNSRRSGDSTAQKNTYTIHDILLLLVSAIVISISQISWAWSLTQTSVANSNLLHNMTPIFTTLGGWLLLGHYFKSEFIIGLLIAIGGTIAIGIQDLQITAKHFTGDALALLSSVFYAAYLLVIEKLRLKFPTATIILWSCFFRCFLTFPVAVLTEDQLFPSSLQEWLPVISLVIFCQVIGSGILVYSLKQFSSWYTSVLLLLDPIMTIILAWIIFDEPLSILNLLAVAVVLVGIYIAIQFS